MPGIVGIISREPATECRRRLAAMVKSMQHEPYYQSATCEAPEMGVYAAWVAHPGSFATSESGSDGDGAVDLVFAGECVQEPGTSLLRLYDRLGENWVLELNGLFSGLLIDRHRQRAFLFNDRYGVERVYVHQTGDATYFASEAKALLRVLPTTRSFDDQGVAEFLTFGCPVEGRTLFRRIHLLEGGSVWTFEGGSCQKRKYFKPVEWECQSTLSAADFASEFQSTFKNALPRYLSGRSRIGISLTGGLDTRMIMACLPVLVTPPVCYTFAGLHGYTLDARISARVASECGLEHQVLRIRPDFLSGYRSYVERTVYNTDGAAGATTAHEIYLNQQARLVSPVRLTGNFGSEVLRGVSTFGRSGLSKELLDADFSRQTESAASFVVGSKSAVTLAAFGEVPSSLFGTMAAAKSQLEFRTPYLDNHLVSLAYRAPTAVRRSAGPALQLVRDNRPGLSAIPTDRAVMINESSLTYTLKRLFAEATFKLDYWHKEALPQWLTPFDSTIGSFANSGLLGLHKYLSYRSWFRKELAKDVIELVTDPTTMGLAFWNRDFLTTMAFSHVGGKKNYVKEINAVITLASVDRLLLRASRPGGSSELP